MRFDWDEFNLPKCTARIPQTDIESLFVSPDLVVCPVASEQESRYRAIGHDAANRAVVVIFTPRFIKGETHIRPISARYAHAREVSKWSANRRKP